MNSIDCKPYYDCFKVDGCVDERHSDTADYRGCADDNSGFKVRFNRSLNSQFDKDKVRIVY